MWFVLDLVGFDTSFAFFRISQAWDRVQYVRSIVIHRRCCFLFVPSNFLFFQLIGNLVKWIHLYRGCLHINTSIYTDFLWSTKLTLSDRIIANSFCVQMQSKLCTFTHKCEIIIFLFDNKTHNFLWFLFPICWPVSFYLSFKFFFRSCFSLPSQWTLLINPPSSDNNVF